MPMQTPNDFEADMTRQAFEAAYRKEFPAICEIFTNKFERGEYGEYRSTTVSVAWQLWQAAIAHAMNLASIAPVPDRWKLVPIKLTERMIDEADFRMGQLAGDAYSDNDDFDGWFTPVWDAMLAAAPVFIPSQHWITTAATERSEKHAHGRSRG